LKRWEAREGWLALPKSGGPINRGIHLNTVFPIKSWKQIASFKRTIWLIHLLFLYFFYMGNCICSQTTQMPTAKVVVHDGRMDEFSYPVKVSYLLQLYPTCFICDSDEMAFDHVVTAVHHDHELKLGQLYFALPLNRLKRHLPPQEMAALAVTASSALSRSGGDKCGSRRQQNLFLPCEGNAKPGGKVSPDSFGISATVDSAVARKGMNRNGGVRGRGKFTATLSTIPEQG